MPGPEIGGGTGWARWARGRTLPFRAGCATRRGPCRPASTVRRGSAPIRDARQVSASGWLRGLSIGLRAESSASRWSRRAMAIGHARGFAFGGRSRRASAADPGFRGFGAGAVVGVAWRTGPTRARRPPLADPDWMSPQSRRSTTTSPPGRTPRACRSGLDQVRATLRVISAKRASRSMPSGRGRCASRYPGARPAKRSFQIGTQYSARKPSRGGWRSHLLEQRPGRTEGPLDSSLRLGSPARITSTPNSPSARHDRVGLLFAVSH